MAGLLAAGSASNAAIIGVEFSGKVYSINETTAAGTLLSDNYLNYPNAMAKNSVGVLYMAGGQGVSALATINPTTGVITDGPPINLGPGIPVQIRGMAFSSADVLYATNQPVVGSFAPPLQLYTINTTTGVGTFIANLAGGIQGLAFSPTDTLYGWDVANDPNGIGLVTIDPATGAITDVNPAIGGNATDVQTLAFSSGGVLYGGRSNLYTIDLATGALTLIGSMAPAQDIRGMEFASLGPPAPAVSLTPPSLAFGSQLVGTTSAAQALTLQNIGTATLNIASIAASGDFAQTNTCGATLAPSATCTISVTFTPTALGVRSGTVSVASNAAGSPHTSALGGTGTAVLAPAVSLTPAALAFGSQLIGTTSAAQALTLQNTGNATLNIASIAASGDFAQTSTCGATLAPSATCLISVTFTPTALGPRSGAVSVASNAAGSPHTAALSGTGTAVPGPPAPIAPIPTLSQWALIVLSVILGLLALGNRKQWPRRR